MQILRCQCDDYHRRLAAPTQLHLSGERILSDFDIIDLAGDETPVNMFALEALADRLIGMGEMYAVANAALPEFRRQISDQTLV